MKIDRPVVMMEVEALDGTDLAHQVDETVTQTAEGEPIPSFEMMGYRT